MTNDKANTIIDVFKTLKELKESGEIIHLDIKWDEENNTLDINVVPKQEIKYIKLDFTITPEGAVFK
jgi:hypothetical protein